MSSPPSTSPSSARARREQAPLLERSPPTPVRRYDASASATASGSPARRQPPSMSSSSIGSASMSMDDDSSLPATTGGPGGSGRVRVGLDAGVLSAQKKWKRLGDISDENSTAKDMASEVQTQFAALRQKQQRQDRQDQELQHLARDGRRHLDIHIEEESDGRASDGDSDSGNEEDENEEADQDANKTAPLADRSPPTNKRRGRGRGRKHIEDEDEAAATVAQRLSEVYRRRSAATVHVDNFAIAAAFIRDGIHGRKILYRIDNRIALVLHEYFHSDLYRMLYTVVVLVSCGLAFIELPGQQNKYLAIDLICTSLFAGDVYIRWYMSSHETKRLFLSRQPWACVRLLLLLLTVLDLAVNVALPMWNPYRYSRALRPFFLIARRRNIRIIFGSCLRALREVLIVLLLMFCLIGFFGLLGFLLFSDASASPSAPYFASLSSSLYTMLLIQNCLPYMVKSMYPYFLLTQWSAVYFVIFVLLTNLFLAKLTIAVSYRSYKQHTEKMLYKRLQKRKAALYAAFDILASEVDYASDQQEQFEETKQENDEEKAPVPPLTIPSRTDLLLRAKEKHGSSRFFTHQSQPSDAHRSSFTRAMEAITPMKKRRMSLETWIQVCHHLKPRWTNVECALVFNTIDIEHIGFLDVNDFYQLCSLLSVKLERTAPSAATAILRCFIPTLRRHTVRRWQDRMRNMLLYEKVVAGRYSVVVSELVVGAFICLSVVQAIQVNNITLAFSVNHSWRIVGFVLLCLFTLEVQLKLFAFGRREFFGRPFCQLDLGIVLVGWCFYAITSFTDDHNVSLVFYDLALAVRSLRILKLLNLFPPFHEILWTMQRILPLIVQLLLVIVSVMYSCAIVTQANYGIALREFPVERADMSPQWYAVRHEFQVDTFAETLVTLFGVANLAGWNMVMDAAHAMTGSNATYVFFFSYRIAMANILLPIFVGFLVESFVSNAKRVEDTIETFVEAAEIRQQQQQQDFQRQRHELKFQQLQNQQVSMTGQPPEYLGDAMSSAIPEEEELALLMNKESGQRRPSAGSASASAASDHGFRMRLKRRGSYVQNEMFDAVRLSDVSRLKLQLEKKEDETASLELEIRQLESNVLGMQSRFNQSQRVILAYEAKMEELSAQLKDAQQQLTATKRRDRHQSYDLAPRSDPTDTVQRTGGKRRSMSSWKMWK